MSTHKCTSSLRQETALSVTRDGKSRAQQATSWTWSSRHLFPWAPTTHMDWDKGKSCWGKFSHKDLFNFLLHSHLETTPHRTGMRQTWSIRDFSLAWVKCLRHESIPKQAWWWSLAWDLLLGAARSEGAEKSLSQQVHTHPVCHTQLG